MNIYLYLFLFMPWKQKIISDIKYVFIAIPIII